jgi:hypothetical protein
LDREFCLSSTGSFNCRPSLDAATTLLAATGAAAAHNQLGFGVVLPPSFHSASPQKKSPAYRLGTTGGA